MTVQGRKFAGRSIVCRKAAGGECAQSRLPRLPPDDRRAKEVSEIRVILETAVADMTVANTTPDRIATLRVLARHFNEMILTGTILAHYEANLAFHRQLLFLGGNRELAYLISEIRQCTSSAPVSLAAHPRPASRNPAAIT